MAVGKKYLLWGITIFLLLSLGAIPAPSAAPEPADQVGGGHAPPPEKTDHPHPAYNDYARFIAGFHHPESTLTSYEKPAWIKYAASMNQGWERFEKRQLIPMREWASRELGPAGTATVFYPFSGPDFINVYTLFPRAETYLMVALEPVGALPDFSAIEARSFFASLQRSLYEYLHIDFFATKRMAKQIAQTELKGVLPVLLFFLARGNARVLDIRYWMMKPDGTIAEQPAVGEENLGEGLPGVRIVFKGPGSAAQQTLYYFQFDLQNSSLKRNQPFSSFLKSFGPLTAFTKAASYLLFKPNSSDLRQFLLERSQFVVQGDSGIPLKFFDPAIWNFKFYGTYKGPLKLFKNRYQEDLAQVYNQGKEVYPLPFGFGYHHRAGTSNLLIAAKKAEESK
jgi:hypothetical protein